MYLTLKLPQRRNQSQTKWWCLFRKGQIFSIQRVWKHSKIEANARKSKTTLSANESLMNSMHALWIFCFCHWLRLEKLHVFISNLLFFFFLQEDKSLKSNTWKGLSASDRRKIHLHSIVFPTGTTKVGCKSRSDFEFKSAIVIWVLEAQLLSSRFTTIQSLKVTLTVKPDSRLWNEQMMFWNPSMFCCLEQKNNKIDLW